MPRPAPSPATPNPAMPSPAGPETPMPKANMPSPARPEVSTSGPARPEPIIHEGDSPQQATPLAEPASFTPGPTTAGPARTPSIDAGTPGTLSNSCGPNSSRSKDAHPGEGSPGPSKASAVRSAVTSTGRTFPETTVAETVNTLRAAGCVFAEEEAMLLVRDAASPGQLAEWVRRRVAGIPLEYILGWAEFDGNRMLVEPGVFVPRRRTELLVSLAAELMSAEAASLGDVRPVGSVVDLCCGSGAVGAALARRFPEADVYAADIERAAVRCARRNIEPLGGHVYQGDLFEALPLNLLGLVQILAVNAPYVPTDSIRTMPPEARLHEPLISLDGGADGLDFHRRVAAGARRWLRPEGHVLIETSQGQAAGTAALLAAEGLFVNTVHADELDGTVVVGGPGPR